LDRTWSFSPLTSCRSRSLEAGKSYSAITIKLSERRSNTIEYSRFGADDAHPSVQQGISPLRSRGMSTPPSPKKQDFHNAAFLPTTTSAWGLKSIHQSASCLCVFKALQTPLSTKPSVSTRKKDLCGIRRAVNNLSVYGLSFTWQ